MTEDTTDTRDDRENRLSNESATDPESDPPQSERPEWGSGPVEPPAGVSDPVDRSEGGSDRTERPDRVERRTDGGSRESTPERSDAVFDGSTTTRDRLLWVALAVLSVLALVALFQFYVSASAAIDQWVAEKYRQVMQAVFNLVVLLLSSIGITLAVRELGG